MIFMLLIILVSGRMAAYALLITGDEISARFILLTCAMSSPPSPGEGVPPPHRIGGSVNPDGPQGGGTAALS
jgi:hypothetical protein